MMLSDIENNKIKLLDYLSPHLLILGMSGSGKTYYLMRKTEEMVATRKKILIFDYSSSYTQEELRKNSFQYLKATKVYNPTDKFEWVFKGENIESVLFNVFVKCLKVGSYYQKKLLKEAISLVATKEKVFSILFLMESLEELRQLKEDAESQKNIVHLLTRLDTFSEGQEIIISKKHGKRAIDYPDVAILQLSNMEEIQRKFWTEFFAELLWNEVRQGHKRADIVVFDEFQHMSLQRGSALESMLREGRKRHIAAYLSSQFIGNRTKDEEDSLLQAENRLFFRPTSKDLKKIASIVDAEHMDEWKKGLENLRRGELVLKGSFTLNDRKKELKGPILCRVVSEAVEEPKKMSKVALELVQHSKLRETIY